MTGANERLFVAALYDGPRWKKRVAAMSDAQVTAIFLKELAKPEHQPRPPHDNEDDFPFNPEGDQE